MSIMQRPSMHPICVSALGHIERVIYRNLSRISIRYMGGSLNRPHISVGGVRAVGTEMSRDVRPTNPWAPDPLIMVRGDTF